MRSIIIAILFLVWPLMGQAQQDCTRFATSRIVCYVDYEILPHSHETIWVHVEGMVHLENSCAVTLTSSGVTNAGVIVQHRWTTCTMDQSAITLINVTSATQQGTARLRYESPR